jgi:hypothetical protein
MASGQRFISWLHPCSTSNVAQNTRTSAHGPLMGHPNWVGCDIHQLAMKKIPFLVRVLISLLVETEGSVQSCLVLSMTSYA